MTTDGSTLLLAYGTMPDGSAVPLVTLHDGDFIVEVITFGAVLRNITLAGRSLVLGCGSLEDYIASSPHFGAVVGRFANRIARGHLDVDGQTYQLALNNGRNHMHGGAPGFSRRNWTLVDHDATSATLRIVAEDGEQGYPGRVEATCRYAIVGPSTLEMTLQATTDRATVVNLTNHSYFNLGDDPTIGGHIVRIAADRYLPLDDENIPTGEISDVAGTRYDFRTPRTIGDDRFDTPFVLGTRRLDEPRAVASVTAPTSGITLDIATTEVCVQLYTGQNIKPGVRDRAGRDYLPGAGLCLETQGFPDSPNRPSFPSAILHPGEKYRQVTRYAFSQD